MIALVGILLYLKTAERKPLYNLTILTLLCGYLIYIAFFNQKKKPYLSGLSVFTVQFILESLFQLRHTGLIHHAHIPLALTASVFVQRRSFVLLMLVQPVLHIPELLTSPEKSSLWLLLFIYLPSLTLFITAYKNKRTIHNYSEKLQTLKREAQIIANEAKEINEDLALSSHIVKEEKLKSEIMELLNIAQKALIAEDVHLFLQRDTGFRCYLSTSEKAPSVEDGGLIQTVLKERDARVVFSEDGEILDSGYVTDAPVRSIAVSSVVDQEVALGVICAESLRYRAFNEKDLEVLRGIASIVAQTFHRHRLLSVLNFAGSSLKILHNESSILTRILDVEEMIKTITSSIQKLSGAGGIVLWRRAASYQVYTSDKLPLRTEKVSIKKLRGTLLDRIHTYREESISINELSRFDKKNPLPEGFPPFESLIAMPLFVNERLQGIAMAVSEKKEAFNQSHISLFRVYLNQASESLSKALLHEEIKQLAFTDGLTGLYNHRRFQERLDEELKRAERYGEPLSLILLDIDHFKRVNDTYGHPAGDAVLKKLAEIIKRTVREIDFPARYGGEEFAIITLKSRARNAEKIAERLRKTVQKTVIKTEDTEITVTLSLGIASYPDDATTREALIEKADQALYKAKNSGRNRTVLYREILNSKL